MKYLSLSGPWALLCAIVRLATISLVTPLLASAADGPEIRTPPPPKTPRINGPSVLGVRPGSPLLYSVPATGERPMVFAVEGLPTGLSFDGNTGRLTGSLAQEATHHVVLKATNRHGTAEKKFRIVVGEQIALTPPMGWNSWNCWADAVDADKVRRSARAMVASGLAQHGWSYINIDDTWAGQRDPASQALQPNSKFPDMAALCDEIHGLGLKVGIYSTPWISTYGGHAGSSSDQPDGTWTEALKDKRELGRYSFARQDALQWAAWGIDYLKYDWRPNDLRSVIAMSSALRDSGRDIVFSISNSAPFELAPELARFTNCWRTTDDIRDRWAGGDPKWALGMSEIGFNQDHWAPYAGPGHWNDPDMLIVGQLGWGPKLRSTQLTPEEQYAHISLWCMLSAPLLLGCDLEHLDDFTIGLLTNDEVLAINQDALGKQGVRRATIGAVDIFVKELEDSSRAIGFFNRDSQPQQVEFGRWQSLGLKGKFQMRDLWRQTDVAVVGEAVPLATTIPAHGVQLYKLTTLTQPTPGK